MGFARGFLHHRAVEVGWLWRHRGVAVQGAGVGANRRCVCAAVTPDPGTAAMVEHGLMRQRANPRAAYGKSTRATCWGCRACGLCAALFVIASFERACVLAVSRGGHVGTGLRLQNLQRSRPRLGLPRWSFGSATGARGVSAGPPGMWGGEFSWAALAPTRMPQIGASAQPARVALVLVRAGRRCFCQ